MLPFLLPYNRSGPGNVRPGYGLYDRALGVMYMLGAWACLQSVLYHRCQVN